MITTQNNGQNNTAQKGLLNPVATPMVDNMKSQSNSSKSDKPHTPWWWLALFLVFLGWGWAQHHQKLNEELKPRNIQANLHNITIITLGAVVGIVGGKVLFTKLAAITANVPLLGRATAYMAQLFAAA